MSKVLFAIFFLTSSFVSSKELALSFDDSPRSAKGYLDGPTRAKKLIEGLRSRKAGPVVFFSVSDRIKNEGVSRINSYVQAGHIIANHTANHPNFNETSLEAYKKNFITAHNKLKGYKTFERYFRFPYLREGNTEVKRDGMRRLFKKMNYFNAYITLNNYDWHIDTLFQKSVNKPGFSFEKMKKFYVDVLIEGIEYHDQMAIRHLKRSPKHVLLLHENDVAALFIGDLIDSLRKKGWKIITSQEAYTDEIANYKTERVFPFNPGRVGEIARDRGQTKGLWHKASNKEYLNKRFKEEVL